jgi:hypothetical protein
MMAAACSQSLPVLVTASTFTKLSLAKVCKKFSLAKAHKNLLSLFAQVRFCSQDRTRRIFQFVHLWLSLYAALVRRKHSLQHKTPFAWYDCYGIYQ